MIHRERRTRWMARAAIAAALAWHASAVQAGEWFPRTSALFAPKPAGAAETKAAGNESPMNWWSIPRPARVAARKLAKSQDATVTRCVAIEKDDKVAYEIHASHRLGLFKRDDYVLTGVTEPKATAEKRREEQTLRRRMERLRDAGAKVVKRGPDEHGSGGAPGSSAFPVR